MRSLWRKKPNGKASSNQASLSKQYNYIGISIISSYPLLFPLAFPKLLLHPYKW